MKGKVIEKRTFVISGKGIIKQRVKYLTLEIQAVDKVSAIIKYLKKNPEYSNSIICGLKFKTQRS